MTLTVSNQQARHLLIATHGLATPPTGPVDVSDIIRDMGFVQLDTIRNVTRAHHHILWSRNQNYREPMLWKALEDRQLFEHFTHDASILPMELFPLWHWQFERLGKRARKRLSATISPELCRNVKARIEVEGALCTKAFDTKIEGPKKMWSRPPHKQALDFMWYSGELTTSHRQNFTKYYDLTDRVIPRPFQTADRTPDAQFDALCRRALNHLTIATPADLQDFWGACGAKDIKAWLATHPDVYVPVRLQTCEGTYIDAVATPDIQAKLNTLNLPTSRLRILNPFDPLVRNRKRLSRFFGFDYTIEIFVPQHKRKWGYYVYPILEGDRFIGRIELKADRKSGHITVIAFWREPRVKWTPNRYQKLRAELHRLATLIGVSQIKTSVLDTAFPKSSPVKNI